LKLELEQKRVLVTGSSSGIGLGIAEAFLEEGSRVILTGRSPEKLALATERLQSSFSAHSVASFLGDLTLATSRTALADYVEQLWSGIDIVVLNLGSGLGLPGLKIDQAEWERMLNLNLLSSISTLEIFQGALRKGTAPAVVFIGSIAGVEDLGAPLSYTAAKAALAAAMKAASRIFALDGIRVNLVAPGNVLFAGGRWAEKLANNPQQVQRMLEEQVPLRRFGEVQEIADAVLFLASPRASFITGSSLMVDGGQTRAF